MMTKMQEFHILKSQMPESMASYLTLSNTHSPRVIFLVSETEYSKLLRTHPKRRINEIVYRKKKWKNKQH